MNDLSGRDLRSLKHRGFDLIDDVREGYLGLSPQAVIRLGGQYGSDYYLTATPQPGFRLLHQEGDWRLYQLREEQRSGREARSSAKRREIS
jgi:hypothetical protein